MQLTQIQLSKRQRCAIRAALFYWQANTDSHERWHDSVATDAPSNAPSDTCIAPLSDAEIDKLCAALNFRAEEQDGVSGFSDETLERMAVDLKKEFTYDKHAGTWAWYDRGDEDDPDARCAGFATRKAALLDALEPYLNPED